MCIHSHDAYDAYDAYSIWNAAISTVEVCPLVPPVDRVMSRPPVRIRHSIGVRAHTMGSEPLAGPGGWGFHLGNVM